MTPSILAQMPKT